MGGSIIAKNISFENSIYLLRPYFMKLFTYFEMIAVIIPMSIAIVDSCI